jgi:hypothetical protein
MACGTPLMRLSVWLSLAGAGQAAGAGPITDLQHQLQCIQTIAQVRVLRAEQHCRIHRACVYWLAWLYPVWPPALGDGASTLH